MKDRKSEIVRENVPLIYWNNIVTSHFAKITPDLDTALNKCEEEFETQYWRKEDDERDNF